MSTRTKKLLSFLLVFALVLQMLPMSVFAESVQLAKDPAIPITAHPDPADSMYCRDNKAEYKADDVLWEIEYERTLTEKHFHLANGSDIAVAYTYPVHYKTNDGKYQEIDNRLKVYNEDGTLSEEPVIQGQEGYLLNKHLQHRRFCRELCVEDFDQCEFCWTVFDKDKGHPSNAYFEPVRKVWICEKCYNDFKTHFHWTVEEIKEEASN